MKKYRILFLVFGAVMCLLTSMSMGKDGDFQTGEAIDIPCGDGYNTVYRHWWPPFNDTRSYFCHNCLDTGWFESGTKCDVKSS